MPEVSKLDQVRQFLHSRPRVVALLFFVFGVLLTLTFAPFGLYFLMPVLFLPALFAWLYLPPRAAAKQTFWYGTGLFLSGTYWLYVSIHVFGQAPLWVAVVIMVCLVLIMAAYCAAAGWAISRLVEGDARRLLLIAPSAWVVVEWLRGWFLSGFPWLAVGYSQIDSPLSGWVPIIGVYGTSVFTILTSAAMLAALLARGRERWLLVGVAVLPWLIGSQLRAIEWTEATERSLRTTIVQGGVSQDRKWLREQFQPTLDLYRNAALAHRGSELIVWPEVAIPSVIDRVEDYIALLQSDLQAAPKTLLFGILERETTKVYNSVVMLDGDHRQIYRKRHLVPFGEFFPVPDFVRRWMRLMSLPASDLSAGDDQQALLQTLGGDRLAVAICYEDAYAAEQLYALPEASVLINVSNDAWFGDTIAPHQHLQIARMRALEAGRYVIRATNTGISAFIGAKGELLATAPQFESATMTMGIIPHEGATPYVRTGNWPVVSLLCLVLLWYARRAIQLRS
ncbi:MAG: apolipoprotein N-acyltransferase [Woeseiaceae bacterium]